MAEKILPFITGSEDRIVGYVYDNVAGVLTLLDLGGAAVSLRFSVNGRAAFSRAATVDPDQVANKGRFTYDLTTTDLVQEGTLSIAAHVTIAGQVHKSQPVVRSAKLAV